METLNPLWNLLRNRNFILLLGLMFGLLLGGGAQYTRPLIIPALALVVMISTIDLSNRIFRSPHLLLVPTLVGIIMNYGVMGGVLLGLNTLLIHDEFLWRGFILLAFVPPAVAVIPFTIFLDGDVEFSLVGAIGCYMTAMIVTPLMIFHFFGSNLVDPIKLLTVMIELILVPLILSRMLVWSNVAPRIKPVRGPITNWSFFIVIYTVVGVNREIFFTKPLSLIPVVTIAVAATFILGLIIEKGGKLFKMKDRKLISFVMLGTLKNSGFASGIALTLFNNETALPAAVYSIFMIIFIIFLSIRKHGK